MNEPSWTTVGLGAVALGADTGDDLRKLDKESLDNGRGARSEPTWAS